MLDIGVYWYRTKGMRPQTKEDMKMTYYVTADSFGSEVPSNWEEIAAFLNSITDERGIAEDHDACNDLWEAYWNGELDGAPEAQA